MASNVTVVVGVNGAAEAAREIKHVGDEAEKAGGSGGPLGKLGGALGDVAKIASGFVIGQGLMQLPGLLSGMVGGASDVAESLSKVGVVFGTNATEIDAWAKTAATRMGMTRGAALEAAGTFGNLFNTMGLGDDDMVAMSEGIVGLAADLGSFNNISSDEALVKLRAGLVGEAEPLRSLGVNLNAAMVEAKAMSMGLVDANGKVTEAGKVQARYALILEQTKTAQGDFARTSEGHANQMKILSARFGDMKAQIGAELLPAIVAMGQAFLDVLPRLQEFAQKGIAAIGPAIQEGFATLRDDVIPWFQETAIPAIQSFAEAARPTFEEIGRIINTYVVPALQAIGQVIAENWPAMKQAIQEAMSAIGEQLTKFGGYYESDIKPATENIRKAIEAVVQFVKDHWPEIERVIRPVMEQVGLVIEGLAKTIRDLVALVVDLIQGDWSGAWKNLKEVVDTQIGLVRGTLDNLVDFLGGLAAIFLELMTAAGEAMRDGLIAGLKGALGLAKDIANAIIELFENAINSVIQMINDAIPDKISIPHLPDINLPDNPIPSVHIPRMASGGIVTRPTMALIGEAGPEAVVPLSGLQAYGSMRPGFGGGGLLAYGGMGPLGPGGMQSYGGGMSYLGNPTNDLAILAGKLYSGVGTREDIYSYIRARAMNGDPLSQAEIDQLLYGGGSTSILGDNGPGSWGVAAAGVMGSAQSGLMGGVGGGGPAIVIQAIDAQSVRDWLNRGGGEEIMRWFRRSVA